MIRFNLVIEILMISRAIAAGRVERQDFKFQSRNRDTYDFKHPTELARQNPVILFQSRNRDTYDFKSY